MRRNLLSALLSIVFLLTCELVSAQTKFEIHGGGAFPQGDFANMNYDQAIFGNSGCAKTGIDLGIKLFQPIRSAKNLSFTLSANFIHNGISDQFKDKFYSSLREQIENQNVALDIKYPAYTNIPILAGLNYIIPLDTKNDLYIDGGIGFNIASVSDLTATAKYNGLSASESMTVKTMSSLAGQIGAGVLFEKQISLGVNYNLLGSYRFSGAMESSDGTKSDITPDGQMSITTLSIYLGYRF